MASDDKITYSDPTLIQLSAAIILIPFITGMFLMFLRAIELRREKKYSEKLTGYIGSFSLSTSWVISLFVLFRYFSDYVKLEGKDFKIQKIQGDYEFLPSDDAPLKFGILLDPLSVIFLVVLTTIASIIHWYATDYMHADPAYTRFFGTMNFFTGSMLGFVLASNFFIGFIFWELLGFSSYLLIGFYWHVPAASSAMKKAFMYNKIGDVAFLIGIALIWRESFTINSVGTLDYAELGAAVNAGDLAFADLILPGLLIFGGAIGKSAQFPLFGWLPEAMEGPTPVSALLHSSTMVKAGLFLVARSFFLFYQKEPFEGSDYAYEIVFEKGLDTYAISTVVWIGVLTALGGAIMALSATDIKKVLAFSTISQLGYIAMALGSGGLAAGLYHIISHATFKSLLFLSAGAVIHSVHSQDMSEMGGLKKYMPWTYWTMGIGLAALSGVIFMSGFWSKDAILLNVVENEYVAFAEVAYAFGILTAILTAFYSTKLFLSIFHGESRYDKDHVHPSPTSMRMRFALVSLATLVVIESIWWTFGSIVFPKEIGWDFEYTLGIALELEGPAFHFDIYPVLAITASFIGILGAYYIYSGKPKPIANTIGDSVLGKVARNRFGLDIALYWMAEGPIMQIGDFFKSIDKEIIDAIVVDRIFAEGALSVADISDRFDQEIIDGAVRFTEQKTRDLGYIFRKVQVGQTGFYARLMAAGLASILLIFSYKNFF